MKKAISRLGAIGAALLSLGATGCMSLDDEPVKLETHVQDWRDEIIYQVLVDRFANGDTANDYNVDTTSLAHWHGGDWKGLEDHLGYIQDLGVTTIWISPVVKNVDTDAGFDGYHGYWTQDLAAPNPHFGDLPALRHMIAAAHDLGLKVILDIVTNHLGQLFYYDINMNGQPDDQVFGGGCDKWDDPSNPDNLYPDYSSTNPTCVVKDGQSGVKHVTEYDPEFNPSGVIQSYTSLGYSGPSPIVFNQDPATNHMPPLPSVFQNPANFNRRGRTINYSIGDQLLHGDFPGGLKDVNTTRCEVKNAMVDVYARWVELADFDGFRIDTVKHVEPEFWRFFAQSIRRRLKKEGKNNFFMFGEAFDGDDRLVGSFTKGGDTPEVPPAPQGDALGAPDLARENSECPAPDGAALNADMLDSAFYFPQYYTAIASVFRDGEGTKKIQDLWDQRATNWGQQKTVDGVGVEPFKLPVNFLDNHDVGRFLFYEFFHTDLAALQSGEIKSQDEFNQIRDKKLRNAFVFLFTEQGIPCVYYGDEQGYEGGNDPANREDLWECSYVEKEATDAASGRKCGRFFGWLQKLTKIRKSYPALTHGDQTVVWATDHTGSEDDAGIFAFERAGGDAGDKYALVVINTNRSKDSIPQDGSSKLKVNVAADTELVDVLGDSRTSYTVASDQTLSIQVSASGAVILVPKSQLAN